MRKAANTPYDYEDLKSDPQHPHKKLGGLEYNTSRGDAETERLVELTRSLSLISEPQVLVRILASKAKRGRS